MASTSGKSFELCCVTLTLADRLNYFFTFEAGGLIADTAVHRFPMVKPARGLVELNTGPQFARAPPPPCVTRDELAKSGTILGYTAESNRFVFSPAPPSSAMFQWVEANYQLNGGQLNSQRMSKVVSGSASRPLTFELSLLSSVNPSVDRITFYFSFSLINPKGEEGVRETCPFEYTPHVIANAQSTNPPPLTIIPASPTPTTATASTQPQLQAVPTTSNPPAVTNPQPQSTPSPPPPPAPAQLQSNPPPPPPPPPQPTQVAPEPTQTAPPPPPPQAQPSAPPPPPQYQYPPSSQYYGPPPPSTQYPYQQYYYPLPPPYQQPPPGQHSGSALRNAINQAVQFHSDSGNEYESDVSGSRVVWRCAVSVPTPTTTDSLVCVLLVYCRMKTRTMNCMNWVCRTTTDRTVTRMSRKVRTARPPHHLLCCCW